MATANFTTKPPMLDVTSCHTGFMKLTYRELGTPQRQIAEKPNQSRRAAQQMRRNNFQTKECPN
jgi:hypothetical protein